MSMCLPSIGHLFDLIICCLDPGKHCDIRMKVERKQNKIQKENNL